MSSKILSSYETQNQMIKVIQNEFDKDLFENMFYKNLHILQFEENYNIIPFKKHSWNQNPAQFCYDEYGDGFSDLYNIILLCNNVSSFFEFTFDNLSEIIKPKRHVLMDMTTYKNI